jgi:hypothetical protein
MCQAGGYKRDMEQIFLPLTVFAQVLTSTCNSAFISIPNGFFSLSISVKDLEFKHKEEDIWIHGLPV